MKDVTVKICGLMKAEDVLFCQDAGVDILGFVTEYPLPVPWNLSEEKAAHLLPFVSPGIRSCIVTGGSPEKVIRLAGELKPSLVQLHYRETLADTIKITEALQPMEIGVIKTIPPGKEDRIHQFGTDDLDVIVKALCDTEIYAILADSRTPENSDQGGTPLDLAFFKTIQGHSTKPVILAGGITPGNVREMIRGSQASYIDVMTGVEASPGEKDPDKILLLLRQVGRQPANGEMAAKKCQKL